MSKRPSSFVDEAYNDDFLELPHEDSAAYCRLCFSISQLEPLFVSQQDASYQQINIIEMCTGIKLSAKTDSPSSICLQCRYVMDEFINFRKLCQRLNRVYRRKRNEMTVAKISEDLGYQYDGGITTTVAAESVVTEVVVPEVQHAVPAVFPGEPAPMELTDESCAVVVTHEPSAFEASVAGNGTVPESLIVHELSDEEVECIEVPTAPTKPSKHNDFNQFFIAMANDWYSCKMCSGMYQSFIQLAQHFRDIHPETALFLRNQLNETYFHCNYSELQTLYFDNQRFFKCDMCDSLLTKHQAVRRHRRRFHGMFDDCRTMRCSVESCECFFMDINAVNRHLAIIHGIQRGKPCWKKSARKQQVASSGTDDANVNGDDDDDDVVLITDEGVSRDSVSPVDVQ